MHMSDALISPTVGITMLGVSSALIWHSAKKLQHGETDRIVPLMGAVGAFVFAAQMVNFSIPGTGSSGHLGGGLLLSILLGPYAAFIVMASILTVQATLFADGGLLALGANIFNLAFFPAFIAYPLIYRPLIKGIRSGPVLSRRLSSFGGLRPMLAALAAAVIGLQLGAFGVVVETTVSGVLAIPFTTFAGLMQGIHLAIGVVEGLVTAAVVAFLLKVRPDVVLSTFRARPLANSQLVTSQSAAPLVLQRPAAQVRPLVLGFLAAALFIGTLISLAASKLPDGLEWSVASVQDQAQNDKVSKDKENSLSRYLGEVQSMTSILPRYSAKPTATGSTSPNTIAQNDAVWKSLSGAIGVLVLASLCLLVSRLWMYRTNSVGGIDQQNQAP